MDEYKQHLRRLAVHDDAFLEAIAVEGSSFTKAVIDERTAALMRVAATIALDAAPASFQHAVALALAAGATSNESVASLEAVTPVTSAARVVHCSPKLALALGTEGADAALVMDVVASAAAHIANELRDRDAPAVAVGGT